MTIADIEKMSISERIQTMEALWNSLNNEPSMMQSPNWHKEVLVKRQQKIERLEAKFITIETLKKQN